MAEFQAGGKISSLTVNGVVIAAGEWNATFEEPPAERAESERKFPGVLLPATNWTATFNEPTVRVVVDRPEDALLGRRRAPKNRRERRAEAARIRRRPTWSV